MARLDIDYVLPLEKVRVRSDGTSQARPRILDAISAQCESFAEDLAEDVARDREQAGGRQGPAGVLYYHFTGADGRPLRISYYQGPVHRGDIEATEGFLQLQEQARALGIRLELQQGQSLDQDLSTTYCLRVSGWMLH